MAKSSLLSQIAGAESEQAEFKRVSNLTEIGRSVCAFLNSNGGALVVGADPKEVVGVESPTELAEKIQRHLLEKLSPRALWSVDVEEVEQKSVIIIDVPQGTEPPYAYGDKIFTRTGAAVKLASGMQITKMIERRSGQAIRWERVPAPGVDLDDLEEKEIRQTAQEGGNNRFYDFRKEKDPEAILEELNLLRGGSVLNGAVVLFGRNPTRRFVQLRVRLARFSGENEMEDSRVLEQNAFANIAEIEKFLRQNVPIASTMTDKIARADTPAYPWLALREALMNALVHRDYSAFDGGVSVSIYNDRIEFWNSGELPEGMTVQVLREGRISRLRNPDIAHVFWLRGYIEAFGTGATRIVRECSRAGLPEPEWRVGGGGVRLIIRSAQSDSSASEELNPRQRKFLETLRSGDRITVGEYSQQFAKDVSERQARNDLSQLTSWGYLRREGRGPSTAYIRTGRRI
jgi:ATP-dependent DNA helicase RecG